jgi:putative restriction endonuclease
MKRELIDDSLWFIHKDGTSLYPWLRYSNRHQRRGFWVSDGSNLIEDAIPIDTVAELVREVFSHGRSVWLSDGGSRTGLFRFGHDAIKSWGAVATVQRLVDHVGKPEHGGKDAHSSKIVEQGEDAGFAQGTDVGGLPVLEAKALADAGYDLVSAAPDGWLMASISGSSAQVMVKPSEGGMLLALPESGMVERVGLHTVEASIPTDMAGVGQVKGAIQLFESLRLLHSLQTHPAAVLSARLEARLAAIPETERTREVRQRIGQDVFREALIDLWQSRCAVTGHALPPALLRASHAKPWAKATDSERLDPFNGLLLAIHLDAMFDTGLIAFDDEGQLLCSSRLDAATRSYYGLDNELSLQSHAPGHTPYLRWHREFVFR